MSKYNVGDKFVLEITRDVTRTDDKTEYYVTNDGRLWATNELDELQKYDKPTISEDTLEMERMKALNDGRNEVWELVKKIKLPVDEGGGGISMVDLKLIFGTISVDAILKDYTPQEALLKLEAYEKEQNEIKVGDVVTIFPRSSGQYDAIVIMVDNENHINVIYADGVTADNVPPQLYKKTGNHIDIKSVLNQIGGQNDE